VIPDELNKPELWADTRMLRSLSQVMIIAAMCALFKRVDKAGGHHLMVYAHNLGDFDGRLITNALSTLAYGVGPCASDEDVD